MAVVQQAARTGVNKSAGGIRPFEIGRDLRAVAELIADAFATELDDRGAAALREMRIMSRLGGLLNIVNMTGGELDDFFGGFVWEEEGQIVGNITVQRADKFGARWQIANVAVAPAWRGRGMSRKLMETAISHIRSHGGKWAVLQVYAENTIARTLYNHLGFEDIGGISDLEAPRQAKGVAPPWIPNFRSFEAAQWQQLYDLANSQWGTQAQWWRALRRSDFQSSIEQQFSEWGWKILGRRRIFRAAVLPNGSAALRESNAQLPSRFEAAAILTVERWSAPHKLQLWVRPEWWGNWEEGLVDWAMNLLAPYPVGKVVTQIAHNHEAARAALVKRGFEVTRTLMTMKLDMASAGAKQVLQHVNMPSELPENVDEEDFEDSVETSSSRSEYDQSSQHEQ